MNTLLVNLSPRLTRAGIVAVALVLGGAAGTALSLGIRGDLPTIWQTSSSDRTTTLESALIPDVAAPLATQASGGFEVSILSDSEGSGERVIGYAVSLPSKGFTDMLGIPRFVNPDRSFVLPSEYGAVSAGEGSSRPGLADSAPSAAIFDSERIQPGAVLRFGPFFEALDQGAALDASAAELAVGHDATIGGAPFRVTLSTLEDGVHELRFEPLSTDAQIVASHPGSRVTVTVNGTALADIKGSTNFAKTEELDVNANQSTVVVSGDIPAGATVSVSIDSIGRVTKGNWDFPLN
ncbi:MAG: hypothetical protein IH609_18630 [Dehalococcoidia bacterium]|nr:hypothetical protein [Dehalococcoidia bacterium]